MNTGGASSGSSEYPQPTQPQRELTAEQRIMSMLEELHNQNRALQEQQAARERQWQEAFDNLRQQIPTATPTPQAPSTPQVEETMPPANPRENTLIGTRHVLPQLSTFEGDKDIYDGWRQEACSKIAVDGPRIGDSNVQIAYVYACLKGIAREKTMHLIGQAGQDFVSLLAELDKWFQDRTRAERALQDFDKCYQNNQSFGEFWIKYHSLAFKSRAIVEWTDPALMQHLKKRVSLKLHDMATPAVLVSNPSTVVKLAEIYESTDLAHRARHRGNNCGSGSLPQAQQPQQPQQQLVQQDNAMDWVATNQIRRTYDYSRDTRPVAQFVSQKELDARRAANVCFTCGNPGHRGRNCAFKCHPDNRLRRPRSPRQQAPLTQVFLTSVQPEASAPQQQLVAPVAEHTIEAEKASP
jgi:Zinc knuckle